MALWPAFHQTHHQGFLQIEPSIPYEESRLFSIYLESWNPWNTEKQKQVYEIIQKLLRPFLHQSPKDLLLKSLLTLSPEPLNAFLKGEQCDVSILHHQLENGIFMQLLNILSQESSYLATILQQMPRVMNGKQKLQQALTLITPQMSDFERAEILMEHLCPTSFSLSKNPAKGRLSKALTEAFEQIAGAAHRKEWPSNSLLIYTYISHDGIGDLIHLIKAEQCITPIFGDTAVFLGIEAPHEDASIYEPHKALLSREKSRIHLLCPPHVFSQPAFSNIQFQVCISQECSFTPFEQPKASLHEIGVNNTWRSRGISMGLKTKDAGIWFETNPSISFKAASDTLLNYLGCPEITDPWYAESIFCTSMLYHELEDRRSILTALLIFQKHRPDIKRIVFKTKTAFCGSHEQLREWRCAGVQRLVIDGKCLFNSLKPGIELILITQPLAKEDWSLFKQMVNGLSGVGGDNTLSEALSNEKTLPPLIFSQHRFKQDGYYGCIEMAKELPDHLPGKSGLIEYLMTGKKYAYWATPRDYATAIAETVALTGYKEMHLAFQALVQHGKATRSLNAFIVPWITEQLFFSRCPDILTERRRILKENLPVATYANSLPNKSCF